jgi:hypothetical protein
MEEVNNIYPPITKIQFDSSQRRYVSMIKSQSDDLCKFKIFPDYIKRAFNSFRRGIIYQENNNNIGFVIWKEKQIIPKSNKVLKNTKKVLYVLLICSNAKNVRLTRLIFYDLEEYCKDKGIEHIQLIPSNDKLEQLYETYGFIKNNNNIEGIMTKNVKLIKIKRNKTRKHRTNNYSKTKKYSMSFNNFDSLQNFKDY